MSALRSIFSPDAIRRNLASVARRFPFPFAYISSLTVWFIIMLWTNVEHNHALSDSMCWALSEGLLLSLVANIWCEFMGWMRRIKPVQLAVLGLVVLDFVAMYMRGGVVATAESVGRSAFVSAIIAGILFLPVAKRYTRRQLWVYTMSQVGACAVAVFIGAVLAISTGIVFSSISLLFGVDNWKVMSSAMILFGVWVPSMVYMSHVPRRKDVGHVFMAPKSPVGAFCKNVMLPVVLIYAGILYVYAAKILISWTLPTASVTWMVTGLMCTSLIMLYGLQRYTFGGDTVSSKAEKIASMVRRYLPVLLLPLLLLMSVGLVYRVGEYGITVSRLYVAAFDVWAFAVVFYLIFRKDANLNLIATSFAVVFALVSVFPGANFTAIGNHVVRSEVRRTLKANGVRTFPIDAEELKSILGRMPRKNAENLASRVEYLDDWDNHSLITDIVTSSDRMTVWNLLPAVADTVVVESLALIDLSYTGYVDIPKGYGRVVRDSDYSRRTLSVDSAGCASVAVNGYKVRLNIDSLATVGDASEPLHAVAVDSLGNAWPMTIVILDIQNSDDRRSPRLDRIAYYIFTN